MTPEKDSVLQRLTGNEIPDIQLFQERRWICLILSPVDIGTEITTSLGNIAQDTPIRKRLLQRPLEVIASSKQKDLEKHTLYGCHAVSFPGISEWVVLGFVCRIPRNGVSFIAFPEIVYPLVLPLLKYTFKGETDDPEDVWSVEISPFKV